MRKHGRTDANQTSIVEALRAAGASVAVTSALGGGFPDLAVGHRGVTMLVEVKDGAAPKRQQQLTPAEERWHREWRGGATVVHSVDEALALIGLVE